MLRSRSKGRNDTYLVDECERAADMTLEFIAPGVKARIRMSVPRFLKRHWWQDAECCDRFAFGSFRPQDRSLHMFKSPLSHGRHAVLNQQQTVTTPRESSIWHPNATVP
jgi:hypothetical protein